MVTKTPEEIQEMRADIAAGKLEPDAIAKHLEAEARNVFGFDAKKDRHGNYIEQGIGSPNNLTENHFAALLKNEQLGLEPKGAYEAAIADLWKRDPARAEKLRLRRPRAA